MAVELICEKNVSLNENIKVEKTSEQIAEITKTFTNSEFGEVRVTQLNGEPWFFASDICRALDIINPSMALTRLDDDEKMTIKLTESHSGKRGGAQKYNVVNEPGLYSLVFGSKKAEAKSFKRWITHEVIPIIRQTGGYVMSGCEAEFINAYFPNFSEQTKLNMVLDLQKSNQEMQNKINHLQNENFLLAEKQIKWADRNLISALVRKYAYEMYGEKSFYKGWNDLKHEILYKHSIALNQRISLYRKNTGKNPVVLELLTDKEVPKVISTLVAMCKVNNIKIQHIISGHLNDATIEP